MDDLSQVRFLAKECTALVVEDSQILQKQQKQFLSKLFKEVYSANDGKEGLDTFIEKTPDVVFTDLNMPKLNGHEMIEEIFKMNPKTQIIVVSAHTDTNTLLESFHLGIADFIPKPINSELLLHTLVRVLKKLDKTHEININNSFSNNEELNEALFNIKTNKIKVNLINDYQGIPISHQGLIIEYYDNSIEIHTTDIQTYVISLKKETFIESESLPKVIYGELDYTDIKRNKVVLKNVQFVDTSIKDRQDIRVVPNEDFKFVINDSKGKLEPKVVDLSIKAIAVQMQSVPNGFEIGKKVALSIAIEQKHSSTFNVKSKDYIGIFGTIIILEKKSDEIFVVFSLDINKSDQDIISKYIYNRELQIIKELKQKIVK